MAYATPAVKRREAPGRSRSCLRINFILLGLHVDTIVTYSAVLDIREETVYFLARLLWLRRCELRTRRGRRALGCYRQAVLVIRWYLDGTRLSRLAADNAIGGSTAYRYLHEGIDVLAALAPDLGSAIVSVKASGHGHLNLDGTVIRTDRSAHPDRMARTCGGRGSTSTTAGTSRCCQTPTAGRSGSLASALAGSTM